jgi:hypothetical protein
MHPHDPTQRQPTDISVVCASARLQPYRFIHKALRALLLQTLQTAGILDVEDLIQRQQLVTEVDRTLTLCEGHIAHENGFLHEPLRARSLRATRAFDNDHWDHLASIESLRLLLQRVRDAQPHDNAPGLAYELYLRLSQFIGESLAHMAEEESALTRILWSHFSDAELRGFIHALESTFSDEEKAFYLAWMARGLSAPELVQVLQAPGEATPPEVFARQMATLKQALPASRWSELVARLDGLSAQGQAPAHPPPNPARHRPTAS